MTSSQIQYHPDHEMAHHGHHNHQSQLHFHQDVIQGQKPKGYLRRVWSNLKTVGRGQPKKDDGVLQGDVRHQGHSQGHHPRDLALTEKENMNWSLQEKTLSNGPRKRKGLGQGRSNNEAVVRTNSKSTLLDHAPLQHHHHHSSQQSHPQQAQYGQPGHSAHTPSNPFYPAHIQIQADNRFLKSDSQNTHQTATSAASTATNGFYNHSTHLIDQESTRTWRGLLASVRQLSHSTSTTGSSTHASSSATSVSSRQRSDSFPHSLPPPPPPPPLPNSALSLADKGKGRHPYQGHAHTLSQSSAAAKSLSSQKMGRQMSAGGSRRLGIVVVGDGAVGKSALTLRFLRDQFHDEYDPTIEDSYCRHIEVDGRMYTLDITDTAGQEEYRGHWNDKFMRSGDGFICVYSIDSTSSFQELVGFRDQIWRAKESQNVPMVMAANKCDLVDRPRGVDSVHGQQFAHLSNAVHVETSAKTGWNVDAIFENLVREIVRMRTLDGLGGFAGGQLDEESKGVPKSKGYVKSATPAPGMNNEPIPDRPGRCCTIM